MSKILGITAALLGATWLAAITVVLAYLAGIVDTQWLIAALTAFIGTFALALVLLLVTNTRRPRGIDPNAPMMDQMSALLDSAARRPRGSARVPDGLTHERDL